MADKLVGIRELKARLSGYLREVKEGHTIVITERGKAVGKISPPEESLEDKTQALIGAGVISWNGRRLNANRTPVKLRPGTKPIAEIVSENRD